MNKLKVPSYIPKQNIRRCAVCKKVIAYFDNTPPPNSKMITSPDFGTGRAIVKGEYHQTYVCKQCQEAD